MQPTDEDLQRGEAARTIDKNRANSDQLCAESVAISLLKKYRECDLPRAADLNWLVSEKDAPQQLLPLPSSVPVSADDALSRRVSYLYIYHFVSFLTQVQLSSDTH